MTLCRQALQPVRTGRGRSILKQRLGDDVWLRGPRCRLTAIVHARIPAHAPHAAVFTTMTMMEANTVFLRDMVDTLMATGNMSEHALCW